jgi:hypothetical protein
MKIIHNYIKACFVPACLGLLLGLLVISDYYSVNFLVSVLGHRDFLKIVPFEFSLCLLIIIGLMILASSVLSRTLSIALEKPDKVFTVILIIGFQTVGLVQGRFDSSDIFFALLFLSWFINILTTKEYEIVGSKLHVLNAIFFIFALLPAINSGLFTFLSTIPLVKAIITSFMIINIIRTKESVIFFMKTLFLVTTLSAIIGIVQEIVYLLNGRILFSVSEKVLSFLIEKNSLGTFVRVPAFTGMHLFLANFLNVGLLMGLNYYLYFSSFLKRKEKLFIITAMALMALALVLTFSKTNVFGLALGVSLSLLIKWRSRIIHFAVIFLVIAAVVQMFGYWEKIFDKLALDVESGEIGLRLDLIKQGLNGFFHKHYLTGVGVGRGVQYTVNVKGWATHNAFILSAVETGLFGFFMFCSIFLFGFLRLIITLPGIQEPQMKTALKILLASLLAYVVNIQFQPDFSSYFNWILLGFIECAVIVFGKESKIKSPLEFSHK